MSLAPFTPQYIQETELANYDLPVPSENSSVMALVQMASIIIDEECGRYDGDGNGSLVYTTYIQRILLQTRNRNLIQLPMKPISAVTPDTVDQLTALATSGTNWSFTGVSGNLLNQPNGMLSGIIGASGRYGYTRQDMSVAYPDLFALINPLNLVTMFGGPAPWVSVDVTNSDYDPKTGEVWIPAGLQLQRYSEVYIVYNSGYDPRNMPPIIKYVCASLVKNALVRGNATTALMSMNLGRSGANATFSKTLLDDTLSAMLTPFKTVRGY